VLLADMMLHAVDAVLSTRGSEKEQKSGGLEEQAAAKLAKTHL